MTTRQTPYADYLADDDIVVVRLRDAPIARTIEGANPWVTIDQTADGMTVAVEVVDAKRRGVDLSGVPERETVERLIAPFELLVFA